MIFLVTMSQSSRGTVGDNRVRRVVTFFFYLLRKRKWKWARREVLKINFLLCFFFLARKQILLFFEPLVLLRRVCKWFARGSAREGCDHLRSLGHRYWFHFGTDCKFRNWLLAGTCRKKMLRDRHFHTLTLNLHIRLRSEFKKERKNWTTNPITKWFRFEAFFICSSILNGSSAF